MLPFLAPVTVNPLAVPPFATVTLQVTDGVAYSFPDLEAEKEATEICTLSIIDEAAQERVFEVMPSYVKYT